jgi:hypothetical protein
VAQSGGELYIVSLSCQPFISSRSGRSSFQNRRINRLVMLDSRGAFYSVSEPCQPFSRSKFKSDFLNFSTSYQTVLAQFLPLYNRLSLKRDAHSTDFSVHVNGECEKDSSHLGLPLLQPTTARSTQSEKGPKPLLNTLPTTYLHPILRWATGLFTK